MAGDPYRVLGLPRGAPLAEVKRAYRRLAKTFHPDSAGEAALPRFLAIQEAYETIVATAPPPARTPRASPAWAAEPARARATRDPGRRPGGAPKPGEPGGTRRRATRKATLGSTSYDEATHEPFEPEWTGAEWYGRASGTYWTVNPKEYADPRKHGPEYQERARRAAETTPPDPGTPVASSDAATEPAPSRPGRRATDPPRARGTAPPQARGTAPPQARGTAPPRPAAPPAPPSSPVADDGSWSSAAERLIRRILAGHGIRDRVVLALLAWPAPGVLAATLIGGATGCSSFSASCRPPADLLPVVAGTLLFALLIAVRPLARVSAAGTVGAALLAFPVAVLGVDRGAVDGAPGDGSRAIAMLAIVWLATALAGLAASRGRILRG